MDMNGPLVAGRLAITRLELEPESGTLYVSGMSARMTASPCLSSCSSTCRDEYRPREQ